MALFSIHAINLKAVIYVHHRPDRQLKKTSTKDKDTDSGTGQSLPQSAEAVERNASPLIDSERSEETGSIR